MDAASVETPPCPLCGSADAARTFQNEFRPFALARCRGCSFHYLSPRASHATLMARYRDASYYSDSDGGGSGYDDYAAQGVALGKTFARMTAELRRRGWTGGDLLEIGCGYGYFLEQARASFRAVEATEYSPGGCERAGKHADRVFAGGLESVPPGARYDLVVAFQVLEHIYDPRAFVRGVRERLRPGGRAVFGVPDMGSPWRHVLGARWPSFKIPEHVLYFDRTTLHRLLIEEGFTGVEAVPYPHAFPAPLLARKFGLRLPARFGASTVWVPRTTIAAAGVR